MIDFRRGAKVVPTRRVLEEIVEWTEPAREQLGLEVELPEANGAQRAHAALAEQRPIEEIYRHAVEETRTTYAPDLVPVGDD
jgi:carboxylate-amine ligase